MTDAARARRLAERIQVVVAETLEMGIKDPRLGFVTITGARVTPDLREAKVFFTVLGDEAAQSDTATALASATGVVRAEIAKQCRLRYTPSLVFIADAVPESGRQMEDLLVKVRAEDAARAAAAADAVPAGDPDPYRLPVTDDDAVGTAATADETNDGPE
ncbi:MAG TPA: 30S ribosome-binding factor RbfA [Mycobacteriales bacterium]|nr:30S ribosome-binding factor RbfA [Mycobacteriales bacterium]